MDDQAVGGFDLERYEARTDLNDDGVEKELPDPDTGEPTGIFITVAGRQGRRAAIARQAAYSHMISKIDGARDFTDEERYEFASRWLAGMVISWRGVRRGGKALEATFDNVFSVLERNPWIRSRVDDWATDNGNFTPPSQS